MIKENFNTRSTNPEKLRIVQFKTEWSGACQILQPVYEELSRHYKGVVDFYCVDADFDKDLLSQYGIKEFPTILFFKNDKIIDHAKGLVSKNKLIAKIENALMD